MRIYHPEDQTAKFELKRKSFGRELKESIVITRADAQEILRRNFQVLLKYDSPIAKYAYQLMTTRLYRPVSLIEYDRRAYTHEHFNTRVTMDNNLRYCDFCYDLFFTIAVAGFLLLIYRACHDTLTYNKKFNILLMMLALLSTVLLALIRNNPLLSLGVLGSLSICRIRTNTRDPRDLGFVPDPWGCAGHPS